MISHQKCCLKVYWNWYWYFVSFLYLNILTYIHTPYINMYLFNYILYINYIVRIPLCDMLRVPRSPSIIIPLPHEWNICLLPIKCIVNIFQKLIRILSQIWGLCKYWFGSADSGVALSGQSCAVTCPQVQLCGRKKGRMTLPVWGADWRSRRREKKQSVRSWDGGWKQSLSPNRFNVKFRCHKNKKHLIRSFGHNTIHIFGWILINFRIFLCSKNSSKRK